MRPHRLGLGSCLAACLLAASACGSGAGRAAPPPLVSAARPCPSGHGFALSLVSDRGGRPTPVAAAVWFARHGGVAGVPDSGWRRVSRSGTAATLVSGSATLHVIRGADRTWQVDSGCS
jgi:hypothetical protein